MKPKPLDTLNHFTVPNSRSPSGTLVALVVAGRLELPPAAGLETAGDAVAEGSRAAMTVAMQNAPSRGRLSKSPPCNNDTALKTTAAITRLTMIFTTWFMEILW